MENLPDGSIHEGASQAPSNVCEDVMCHAIVGEQGSRGQLERQSWEGCADSLGNGGARFVLGLRVKATPALCSHIQQTCYRPGGCGPAIFSLLGADRGRCHHGG